MSRPFKEIPKVNTPPENGIYYTVTEVVKLTGLHRHTLQSWLRSGRVKGKLIGCTWHVYKEELYKGE